MKSLRLFLPGLFCFLLVSATALRADSSLDLQPNDTMQIILQRQIGRSVELRMRSGEKIGGKLEKVNAKLAHLTQLTGAEYFDAVVSLDDIAAVVVRAKAK